MMNYLPAALALLLGAAGWYYLFYSPAARRLLEFEGPVRNRRRIRLRKTNGMLMLLLALLLSVGVYGFDPDRPGLLFLFTWLGVVVLLVGIVVLAMLDVRLTRRLRRPGPPGDSS